MISVLRARSWLGLAELATRDTLLRELIESATGTLQRELGCYLGLPEDLTELLDGGHRTVILRDLPVAGPPSGLVTVTVRTRASLTAAWETPAATTYTRTGRALRHTYHWPHGRQAVEVTYRRGYELDAGPAELRGLVREMVAQAWKARGKEHLSGERMGDYSWTRRDLAQMTDWPQVVRRWQRGLAP